ncbi:MAG: ABC transporter permease subunit [Deltaproteobacteria bacterium]
MLRALCTKELRLALRSRRVAWAGAVMFALCGVAAASGTLEHQARAEEHRRLVEFAEASFAGQRADHPHTIAHNGYVVSRPPAPLGHLDAGIETAYGRWLRLDAHQTRPLSGTRTTEIARGPGAGRFDLGLLLAVFGPVVIVLLVFDQVARERNNGTLAMLSSAGLGLGPFVVSKAFGAAVRAGLAIGVPALVATALATLAVGSVDLARLAAWFAAHAVALAVWGAIVLAISAFSASARQALVTGFAVWGTLALFVPPVSGAVSQLVAPVAPPGEQMVKAAEWAESAHAQSEALRDRALAEIRRRHPEWDGKGEPPEVVDAVMLALADRDATSKMNAMFAALDAEQDRQERWAAALAFVSPSGLASLASSAIAGSDLAHMRFAFLHYEAYRQELMGWFNAWWAKEGRGGFEAYGDEKKFDDFEAAPRPTVPRVDLPFSLTRAAMSVALLAVAFVIGALAFAASARRALATAGGRA